MRNELPTNSCSPTSRSSVAITRASLFKFVGILVGVFLLTCYALVYVAQNLDRAEEIDNVLYTKKAVESLEKSLRSTVKDYAFWGDAYKYLHIHVDGDWAYVRQNIGTKLYTEFGCRGVFVVNAINRTVYALIKGERVSVKVEQWLEQPSRRDRSD